MRLKKFLSLALAIVSLVGASSGLYSSGDGLYSSGEKTQEEVKDLEKHAIDGLILLQKKTTTPSNPENVKNDDTNKRKNDIVIFGECKVFLNLLNSVVTPIKGVRDIGAKINYVVIILNNYEYNGFSINYYDNFIDRLFKELKIDKKNNEKENREYFYKICKASLKHLISLGSLNVHYTGGQKRGRPEEISDISFKHVWQLSSQHPITCTCVSNPRK